MRSRERENEEGAKKRERNLELSRFILPVEKCRGNQGQLDVLVF